MMRRPIQREHSFQAWADRLIDRVVLPPMFTTGIDHASTDMAKIGRVAKLQGRGIKFGIPDVFVAQGPCCAAWLELKRGSAVTASQAGVHVAMTRAGQFVAVCETMAHVVAALRAAGFVLHTNADEIAREYEARLDGAEVAPRVVKKRSGRASKPRARRRAGGITSAMMAGIGR